MGPFMVEIVFCRVTRRGRKKMSGMNKLARENMRNDGPMQSFIPQDDMLRVTLDLSGKTVWRRLRVVTAHSRRINIQKTRQWSSLLFGGQYLFNSLSCE